MPIRFLIKIFRSNYRSSVENAQLTASSKTETAIFFHHTDTLTSRLKTINRFFSKKQLLDTLSF